MTMAAFQAWRHVCAGAVGAAQEYLTTRSWCLLVVRREGNGPTHHVL